MWMAIGYESKKTYAKGNTKADCFRMLQKKYPYKTARNRRSITNQPLYKGRLIITKGVDK